MANKKVGQPIFPLQLAHQIEHLRLNRHIQRRCGFVTNQKTRLRRQRATRQKERSAKRLGFSIKV